MQKVINQETLENRIDHYNDLMNKDDESKPKILENLESEREIKIAKEAHDWGFQKGVHRGIYETLQSLKVDMVELAKDLNDQGSFT